MKILSTVEVYLNHREAYDSIIESIKSEYHNETPHMAIQLHGIFFESEDILCYVMLSGFKIAYIPLLGGWRTLAGESADPIVTSSGSKLIN